MALMAEGLEVPLVEGGAADTDRGDVVDLVHDLGDPTLGAVTTERLDRGVVVAGPIPCARVATGARRPTPQIVNVTGPGSGVRALRTARASESKAAAVAGARGRGRHIYFFDSTGGTTRVRLRSASSRRKRR